MRASRSHRWLGQNRIGRGYRALAVGRPSLIRVMNESADEITHPCGESVESAAKIVANRLSLFWVLQNFSDFLKDRIAIGWEHVVEPVKGLNDAHRRPSRPIEPARSGQFEVDDESVKVNRAEPRICVDCDFGGRRQ